MDTDFSEYMRKNGSKGGEARAKLPKEVLTFIAKKAWQTRRKKPVKKVAKVVLPEH